jgi:secondary thiamine-phosphate synthase enzyme
MSCEIFSHSLSVPTRGKGTYELTAQLVDFVRRCSVREGQLTVFVRHTSASLVIMENADPEARTDLHAFFDYLVPEDLPFLVHTDEGPDDSPSHLRMALTRTSEVIPVVGGRLVLGTWQGVFLFEHRRSPHVREVVLSMTGTKDPH